MLGLRLYEASFAAIILSVFSSFFNVNACSPPARTPPPWELIADVYDDYEGGEDENITSDFIPKKALYSSSTTTTDVPPGTPFSPKFLPGRDCGRSQYYSVGTYHQNGPEALEHQSPWHVLIQIQDYPIDVKCSGSIIHEKWIITSANCAKEARNNPNIITIAMAIHNKGVRSAVTSYAKVTDVAFHPKFVAHKARYDVALLKLAVSLNFNLDWRIQRVCLPENCEETCGTEYSPGYISGWGMPGPSDYAEFIPTSEDETLLETELSIFPSNYCFDDDAASDATTLLAEQLIICAGTSSSVYSEASFCRGDSGSPLTCTNNGTRELIGVAVVAQGCSSTKPVGLFTKICPPEILNWITATMAT